MIAIRRIEPHEIPTAKDLIYRIAHQLFLDGRTLEEAVVYYEARGQLHDMDKVQETYFDNDGLFLVMTDEDRIIGTGAIRKLDDTTCELQRVWLAAL